MHVTIYHISSFANESLKNKWFANECGFVIFIGNKNNFHLIF